MIAVLLSSFTRVFAESKWEILQILGHGKCPFFLSVLFLEETTRGGED